MTKPSSVVHASAGTFQRWDAAATSIARARAGEAKHVRLILHAPRSIGRVLTPARIDMRIIERRHFKAHVVPGNIEFLSHKLCKRRARALSEFARVGEDRRRVVGCNSDPTRNHLRPGAALHRPFDGNENSGSRSRFYEPAT